MASSTSLDLHVHADLLQHGRDRLVDHRRVVGLAAVARGASRRACCRSSRARRRSPSSSRRRRADSRPTCRGRTGCTARRPCRTTGVGRDRAGVADGVAEDRATWPATSVDRVRDRLAHPHVVEAQVRERAVERDPEVRERGELDRRRCPELPFRRVDVLRRRVLDHVDAAALDLVGAVADLNDRHPLDRVEVCRALVRTVRDAAAGILGPAVDHDGRTRLVGLERERPGAVGPGDAVVVAELLHLLRGSQSSSSRSRASRGRR